MKTANEIVHHLNETGQSVYDLSEELGLSRTTLYQRLKRLGYLEDKENNKWFYDGDQGNEPGHTDIVTRIRKAASKGSVKNLDKVEAKVELNIHEALMKIDIGNESVRTTISIPAEYRDRMKELSDRTRLRLTDLYALAIDELLKKYGLSE